MLTGFAEGAGGGGVEVWLADLLLLGLHEINRSEAIDAINKGLIFIFKKHYA